MAILFAGAGFYLGNNVSLLPILHNTNGDVNFLIYLYFYGISIHYVSRLLKTKYTKNVWIKLGTILLGIYLLCWPVSGIAFDTDIGLLVGIFCLGVELSSYSSTCIDGYFMRKIIDYLGRINYYVYLVHLPIYYVLFYYNHATNSIIDIKVYNSNISLFIMTILFSLLFAGWCRAFCMYITKRHEN